MLPRMPRTLIVALFAAALAGCTGAEDTPNNASDQIVGVIEARQANFKAMKEANDALKREVEADSPDPAVFRANAGVLINHAANIAGGFPAGSGPEAGVETEALPAIWERKAQFDARARTLQDVLQQFSVTAAGSDMAATVAGVAQVGDACRECHEEFRKRD